MPIHYDYSLDLPCDPRRVYEVITNWHNSQLLGEDQWIEGKPWRPGSTRVVEMLSPIRSTHKQKVLVAVPGERLEVISHGLGYTMQTRILMEEAPLGRTELRFVIDIEGSLPLIGMTIGELVKRFMTKYLEEIRARCQVMPLNAVG
jgi:hypothetical protein